MPSMLFLGSGEITVKLITVCRYTSDRRSIVIRDSQANVIMIALSFIYRVRLQNSTICFVSDLIPLFLTLADMECAAKKELILIYLKTTAQLSSQRTVIDVIVRRSAVPCNLRCQEEQQR